VNATGVTSHGVGGSGTGLFLGVEPAENFPAAVLVRPLLGERPGRRRC